MVDDRSQSGPAGPREAAPQAGDTMFCSRIVSWTQVRQGISFGFLGFLGDHPSWIPQLEGSTLGGERGGEVLRPGGRDNKIPQFENKKQNKKQKHLRQLVKKAVPI